MKRFASVFVLAGVMFAVFSGGVNAKDSGRVAASIAPLHALVSGVVKGAEKTDLIVKSGISPHGFSLSPSHVRSIRNAKAVFYISGGLEGFLNNALRSVPSGVRTVAVADNSGLSLMKVRKSGEWESDGHDHGNHNLHIWLSPPMAEKIVKIITREMSKANPGERSRYKKNARALIARLKKLDAKIRKELAGVKGIPYVVFHDAYIYFEKLYGLKPVGSITFNPDSPPSAAEITRIRKKIRKSGAVCVFGEPQFSRKIMKTVVEGTDAKIGVIDPLGSGITPGEDLYFEVVENLAREIKDCLS